MTQQSGTIEVHVNGEARGLRPGATVADLVPTEWQGVAVARNDEIVPRAQWSATTLQPGDAIEIVRPVQGG